MPKHAARQPVRARKAPDAARSAPDAQRSGPASASAPAPRFSIGDIPLLPQESLPDAALPNRTGLPDGLKSGIEALSGLSMNDVRVHRNSPHPGKLGALAYARGTDIHLGPGQERHLPHEAWHVVQQKQGRVRATSRFGGTPVNEHEGLEREADGMGAFAFRAPVAGSARPGGYRRGRGLTARGQVSVGMAPIVSPPPASPGCGTVQRASAGVWGALGGGVLGGLLGNMVPGVGMGLGAGLGAALGGLAATFTRRFFDKHQKKRGEWAVPSVRKAAKKIAAKNPSWGGYAIHHKLPRHELDSFHDQLSGSGGKGAGVRNALDAIMPAVSDRRRQLHNLPGNLEVGPLPEDRTDDPGAGFDPNMVPGGTGLLTPRSKTLKDMRKAMDTLDWKTVERKLHELKGHHDAQLIKDGLRKAPPLSAPIAWKQHKGKFQ
ncbi:MAG TPA: DUF4157 domain-containing protein [Allosphingosinicella sp.]